MRRLMLLLLCLILILASSHAQDGRGVIRYAVVNDLDTQFTSLNPLMCNDAVCRELVPLLYPTLFGIDANTRYITAGTDENNALASAWEYTNGTQSLTIQLRDDARWSDGTPITAYDYFYSFSASRSAYADTSVNTMQSIHQVVAGVVPVNETTLSIIFKEPTCDALPSINLPLVPAHVFDETFAKTVTEFFNARSEQLWQAWETDNSYDFSYLQAHPYNDAPTVTAGIARFVDWDHQEHLRLETDGAALEIVPVDNQTSAINRLLEGDNSLVLDFPYERISDIAPNPDIQMIELPSEVYGYLSFNLADPSQPRSAFDKDGNPLDQGEHPILSNRDVRQAIQLGIDRQALIEIGLHGRGQQIGSNASPLSWTQNPDLTLSEYNPDEAEHLLETVGWVRVGGRSIRECVNCGTADEGTSLTLTLNHNASDYFPVVAILIQQQLSRIGIRVTLSSGGVSDASQQRFDLNMNLWGDRYPASPVLEYLLLPENDIIGQGINAISYNNPDVTALINQANSLPNCDFEQRQALYQEVQAILHQDIAYIPLFSPTVTVATRADIHNITIQNKNVFWNLDDWVVFDAP